MFVNVAKFYCSSSTSSKNSVTHVEVNATKHLQIENAVKLDDLINELKLDHEMNLLLNEARQ